MYSPNNATTSYTSLRVSDRPCQERDAPQMNLLRLFQQTSPDKPLGGRYKVISQLAAGGFGQTFLAHDLHLPGQPKCVVKQLKPQVSDAESLQTARRLFDTEAQVLYHLGNHDQIPRLLAHFEESQEFYLAQELIEGEPLTEEFVSGEAWPEVKVIALVQDMLQVLAFVHQQHVIHRDIKPSNLIRRRRDGRIVLIDFGAVKQVSTQVLNPKTGKTNMTISIGTQGYMPKEQLGGNPRFSSDVYAVGIIGIQALTGLHPRFLPEDPQTGEIAWHDRIQQASPEFIAILDRMVRYDFRARYVTAADALQALRSLPKELLESVPPPQPIPHPSSATPLPEPPPPTATGQTMPVQGLSPNPNPPAAPATATGETLPLGGRSPNPNPAPQPEPQSATQNSVPTVPVSPGRLPSPAASAPTVTLQNVLNKYAIKPWQIGAGVLALGATLWIGKALLFSQPATQTASNGSNASAVNPAATNDPKQATDLLSQADGLRQAENYSEAITTYEKAIAFKSDDAKAHWGLCFSLNQMGKPTEAIAACDRALALNPNYAEALWSKGNALHQQQNYEEEIKLYNQALQINPEYAEAWNNLGVAYLKSKRPQEAFDALDKATQVKSDWAEAWANRGAALWELRRYDDAITSIQKALEIDPNHPNANNLLQQARRNLGSYVDKKVKNKDNSEKAKGKNKNRD
ncbi:MAG TPA: serine/threonine-protein kinase [Coleofasciculaceae cyanobacterium]